MSRLSTATAVLLFTLAAAVVPTAAVAATTTTTVEAESIAIAAGTGAVVDDASASQGKALGVWAPTTVRSTIKAPVGRVALRLRGTQCAGAPVAAITVDGKALASVSVTWTAWQWVSADLSPALASGSHTISVAYANDYAGGGCDRNLLIDAIVITATVTAPAATPAPAAKPGPTVQAESLALTPTSAGTVVSDSSATGGAAKMLWANGSIGVHASVGFGTVAASVRGDQCAGAPTARFVIDGTSYPAAAVSWTTWHTIQVTLSSPLAAGSHTVSIAYDNNDASGSCDRNLLIDWVGVDVAASQLSPATTAQSSTQTPSTGTTKLYRDPKSLASQAVASLQAAGNTSEASLINKIAMQPTAIWLGGSGYDVTRVNEALAGAAADKSRAIFTIYSIPNRDSGQFASGGAASAAAYRAWIDGIAAAVGNRATVMIIEPDAVAMPLPDAAEQAERWTLLQYAINKLGALADTKVYLDAGNSSWWPAADIVPRLKAAGIANADGFATNTSNFQAPWDEYLYGLTISAALGGKHFVIDTSRNGAGPLVGATGTAAWCNPAGRRLGVRPVMPSGLPSLDAYLWIKPPGETDGPCNGGPASGWFENYAVTLAKTATW